MPTRTREINRQLVRQAEKALLKKIEVIRTQELPEALRAIGEEAVNHSRITHEYNNRSGKLEQSHFAQVVGPGQSVDIEFIGKGGATFTQNVKNDPDEITLVLGARQYYGFFVEVFHGFSVVLTTFLKLRREMGTLLGVRLRSKKLF